MLALFPAEKPNQTCWLHQVNREKAIGMNKTIMESLFDVESPLQNLILKRLTNQLEGGMPSRLPAEQSGRDILSKALTKVR
jgi:hypothetical protein